MATATAGRQVSPRERPVTAARGRPAAAPRWGIASFPAIGTTARVLVTQAQRLGDAVEVVSAQLEQLDVTASRFRADSEVAAIATGTPARVSPLLLSLVQAALRAARVTGGAVDPTVGGSLAALGYDRDFTAVPADSGAALLVRRAPGWSAVEVDPAAGTVRVPAGVVLDLGATAKAYAADRAAADAAAAAGCGVLVSLGGDVAVAGACPPDGWTVRLADDSAASGADLPSVRIRTGGLATSSTEVRRWRRGGVGVHHIVDPVTGLPADSPWRTVSVAAASCLDAQIAATATMVRGLAWLAPTGLPARLVGTGGDVRTVGGWPA
jgi:thiamine biosynthesis lipoprotein